jgi:hypothetical protein
MNIFSSCASSGLLMVVGCQLVWPQGSSACRTSKLTDDDARILLYVTPAAVEARKVGTDVDLEQSKPSKEFQAAVYFVAALVSQRPTSNSVLGNGILGYFVVDKRNGEVQSLNNFSPVAGGELQRVQSWMRHGHCIHAQSK